MLQFVATMTVDQLRTVISEEVQKNFLANTPPPSEKFLTPKETCSMLGVSLQTLANYECKGSLIPSRIGRKVLYKESAIRAALITFKKYKTNTQN